LALGIYVSNKKGVFSKINHKNAEDPVKSFFHEKSALPFCYSAVQAFAEWPEEIEVKN
jgi:hypothetical protein